MIGLTKLNKFRAMDLLDVNSLCQTMWGIIQGLLVSIQLYVKSKKYEVSPTTEAISVVYQLISDVSCQYKTCKKSQSALKISTRQ